MSSVRFPFLAAIMIGGCDEPDLIHAPCNLAYSMRDEASSMGEVVSDADGDPEHPSSAVNDNDIETSWIPVVDHQSGHSTTETVTLDPYSGYGAPEIDRIVVILELITEPADESFVLIRLDVEDLGDDRLLEYWNGTALFGWEGVQTKTIDLDPPLPVSEVNVSQHTDAAGALAQIFEVELYNASGTCW